MSAAGFAIGALRALVEMLGLCLIGQGMLHVLAGSGRRANPIYALFELLTRLPRGLVAACLPRGSSPALVGASTFIALFALWIALAWCKKFI